MKHQKDILFFAMFNYSWSDIFVHESFQIKASPKINFDNINEPSLTLNFSNPDKKSVNKKPFFFIKIEDEQRTDNFYKKRSVFKIHHFIP